MILHLCSKNARKCPDDCFLVDAGLDTEPISTKPHSAQIAVSAVAAFVECKQTHGASESLDNITVKSFFNASSAISNKHSAQSSAVKDTARKAALLNKQRAKQRCRMLQYN